MAQLKFIKNLLCESKTAPTLWKGNFAAGASQAIDVGDLLEFTGNTNTEFVPLDSDYDMSGNGGDLAVAAEKIASGDRAGNYNIWLIMPWDVWEIDFSNANNPAWGTALYYNAANKVTSTAGTNIVGHVAMDVHYPSQGHLSVDGSPDAGTTRRSVSRVWMTFEPSNSYASRLQPNA